MKRIRRYLPLLLAPVFCIHYAAAQSAFDVNFGLGAVQDKASSTGVDTNTLQNCTLGAANCGSTPSLNAFMIGIGGNLMLWKRFGVGVEANIQPAKHDFVALQQQINTLGQPGITLAYRTTFYDFNGIFQPVNQKKVAVQLMAGFGGVNLKFYENASSSNAIAGSSNSSQYALSSNHFQVHGGAGVQIYLTDHIFLRPQFDVRYVPNFIQFGRNVVTSEMVWIGYSFGDRP